jgi:hypothetical protein
VPLARAAASAALFLVSWGLIHHGFYARDQIVDTPIYQRYGESMTRGEVPYRDFELEYPPAALPVFLLPALACVVIVALVATSWWAPFFVAMTPLMLGSVMLSRFDLWPAALTLVALALLLAGRFRLGLTVLGVATAAKLYPAVLVPIAVAHVWRSRGRKEALVGAGAFAAVVAAIIAPFALLAPEGVWEAVWRQTERPLQLESLGAGLLLASDHLFGVDLTMESSHGSQNLRGGAAEALAVVSTLLQVVALVAVWVWHARGPATRERLLTAAAAAVTAFVAFGKVFSPQFLIWLIPLVPLVGLAATGLLAVALILTQLWFPFRYWELALEFDPLASALVLARDLVLVALTVTLIARARRGRARKS